MWMRLIISGCQQGLLGNRFDLDFIFMMRGDRFAWQLQAFAWTNHTLALGAQWSSLQHFCKVACVSQLALHTPWVGEVTEQCRLNWECYSLLTLKHLHPRTAAIKSISHSCWEIHSLDKPLRQNREPLEVARNLALSICCFQAGTCSHLNMVVITPSASRAIWGQH